MTTYELHNDMKLADKVFHSILFEYEESDNQEDLFAPQHTRFDCTITRGDKSFTFDYQYLMESKRTRLASVPLKA